jgi:hypothetical protein
MVTVVPVGVCGRGGGGERVVAVVVVPRTHHSPTNNTHQQHHPPPLPTTTPPTYLRHHPPHTALPHPPGWVTQSFGAVVLPVRTRLPKFLRRYLCSLCRFCQCRVSMRSVLSVCGPASVGTGPLHHPRSCSDQGLPGVFEV